jgi:signal transduction histidine kinase/ligand-binding sensor domain-containing protein
MVVPFSQILTTIAFLALCLLTAAPTLLALNPARSITEFGVTSWTESNGLPSIKINAVLQTQDGYLWLATDGGLTRFDGIRFDTYSMSNSRIASNSVASLWEDAPGVLWIGFMTTGVCRLQAEVFTCFGKDQGLPPGQVRSITGDHQGTVWFAVVGSGIGRYQNSGLQMFTTANGLPTNGVSNLHWSSGNRLWISTFDAGAVLFQNGRFIRIAKPVLPSNLVWSIEEDRFGQVWIATFQGLCKFKSSGDPSPVIFTKAAGLPGNNVAHVFADHSNKIWVTTANGGLSRLDDGRFSSLTSADGLADMNVLDLAEDAEGDLWLATSGGVTRLRDQPFTLMGERQGLPEDAVRIIFENRQLDLWAGTYDKGLVRIVSHGLPAKLERTTIENCSPLAAYQGHDDDLWLGCAGGTILRRHAAKTVARYPLAAGNRFVEVNAISQMANSRLFAATFGAGVAEFRGGRWIPHSVVPEVTNATSILGGSDGLWIGTLGYGVILLQPDGKVIRYNLGSEASRPISFHRDSDRSMWVVLEHGLGHITNSNLQILPLTGSQLADASLYNLLDDGHGFYWISSGSGIYQVNRSDLLGLAKGRSPQHPFVHYGSVDGARGVNFVGYANPTALQSSDGRLWFSSTKGLLSVDPRFIQTNMLQPAVFVQAVLADDKPVVAARPNVPLAIPANKHRLEIQYTGLSLKLPEKVQFSYRLENFDSDWINARLRRSAFYTDLPPGDYVFRIRASNSDGVWNEQGARIAIRKEPFYYQTWWFRVALLLAIGAAAWFSYRRHLDRVRREVRLVDTAIAQEQERAGREKLLELGKANQVLQKAAGKLTQDPVPERFLGVFLQEAMSLAGASAGAVFRRIGDTELVFAALIQDGVEMPASELETLPCAIEKRQASREDKGGYFARLMSGKISSWRTDEPEECCPPIALQYHRDHGHRAIWEFPFSVDERVEGAIALAFRTLDVPSDLVIQTLGALNSQLAVALKLTSLNEESKRAALSLEREQTLTEERSRVAREIHDTLTQSFTGILMQLQAAAAYFQRNQQVAAACIDRAESMARDGLIQARASVLALSPKPPRMDLVDRIRSTVERALTDTGTASQVVVNGPVRPMDAIVAANVLRICQEALSNAQRYSGADLISVLLDFEPSAFTMTIKDDGAGFDAEGAADLGFGLSGMETRAKRIGGELTLASTLGAGTSVRLRLPLKRD